MCEFGGFRFVGGFAGDVRFFCCGEWRRDFLGGIDGGELLTGIIWVESVQKLIFHWSAMHAFASLAQ